MPVSASLRDCYTTSSGSGLMTQWLSQDRFAASLLQDVISCSKTVDGLGSEQVSFSVLAWLPATGGRPPQVLKGRCDP